MKQKIINWLNEYKETTNCKGVVLGISGGKDSTVVAMLSKLVFGEDVFGVIMPNGVQSDIDDAIQICETLNLKYSIVNIGKAYDALLGSIEYKTVKDYETLDRTIVDNGPKISDKARTNVPPRLRMTTLYAIAQTLGYRVIGTGNASERYIGWFTKYGDGGCDVNPIAHLTCTEVVELGKELCEEFDLPVDLIVKKPADGLTGKSDEENFGFTYEQLDKRIMYGSSGDKNLDKKLAKMHLLARHKVELPNTYGNDILNVSRLIKDIDEDKVDY